MLLEREGEWIGCLLWVTDSVPSYTIGHATENTWGDSWGRTAFGDILQKGDLTQNEGAPTTIWDLAGESPAGPTSPGPSCVENFNAGSMRELSRTLRTGVILGKC